MSVMDGAEIRKERILDMLNHVRVFFPDGITTNQMILYMTLNHGLTEKTVKSYMKICEYAGVLKLINAKYFVREAEFKKLINYQSPRTVPESLDGLMGKSGDLTNAVEEIEAEGGDDRAPEEEPGTSPQVPAKSVSAKKSRRREPGLV